MKVIVYLNPLNQVLIWDVEAQPNRHAVLGAADSRPDLVCSLLFVGFVFVLSFSLTMLHVCVVLCCVVLFCFVALIKSMHALSFCFLI